MTSLRSYLLNNAFKLSIGWRRMVVVVLVVMMTVGAQARTKGRW